MLRASVIIPSDREGSDAERAFSTVLSQSAEHLLEVLVVSSETRSLPNDPRIRNVVVQERNPAVRRNRAAAEAEGEVLGFIDDDAFAAPGWIETAVAYLEAHPDIVALGGPDPAPEDSTPGERVSEVLLSTPWIGSGVLCHEGPPGIHRIDSPHDLALVNLFVRRREFLDCGGFDESIGYIGEDTHLLDRLLRSGGIVYHSGVLVHHRRREFPGPYLRQRWRYRVKTGRMLVSGGPYRRNRKIALFLLSGALAILLTILIPPVGIGLVIVYVVLTGILGNRATNLAPGHRIALPAAFALHHATYFLGIVTGIVAEAGRRLLAWRGSRAENGPSQQ